MVKPKASQNKGSVGHRESTPESGETSFELELANVITTHLFEFILRPLDAAVVCRRPVRRVIMGTVSDTALSE